MLFNGLDEDQQKAAAHMAGRATVLAGPGSGKTRVIVHRVAQLLNHGVEVDKILCMTFSVAAAGEMRKRISELTRIPDAALKPTVSTFHSQAFRILREEQEHLPFYLELPPFMPGDVKRLLRKGWIKPQIAPIIEKEDDIRDMIEALGRFRRRLLTPEAAQAGAVGERAQRYAKYYAEYDKSLYMLGKVDFDSMVYWAVWLLRQSKCDHWTYRYHHVIVDETHDTSPDQAIFAEQLAKGGSLFVVGDPSQSIYGFRGASNSLLLSDNSRTIYYLGKNYRSGEKIIAAFRPFAEKDRLSVKLSDAMQSTSTAPGQVKLLQFNGEDAQTSAIIEQIRDAIMQGVSLPIDFAVLSRTRALLVPYADALGDLGIPYRWLDKNFWSSTEVQGALAFIRLALNPNDLKAFHQIVCSSAEATKFLGAAFADDIIQVAIDQGIPPLEVEEPEDSRLKYQIPRWRTAREILRSLIQEAPSMTPAVFLTAIMKRTGLGPGEDQVEPDDFRQENLTQLIQRSTRFVDLKEFLQHADRMKKKRSEAKGVSLSTIHGAKGLEWSNVFVIGVCDGILPHIKASDQDEERRILYVALSRARNHLYITWHGMVSPLIKVGLKDEYQRLKIETAALTRGIPGF